MTEQPRPQENRPAFDAGAFSITYLSSSPQGFEIQTRERLLRHAPGTPLPEGKRIAQQRRSESLAYRVSTVYPHGKETLEDVRERLLARKRPDGKQEIPPENIIIEGDHIRLIPGFHPRVGPRNISQEGNRVIMDVMPVTFPTYRAINDPHESQEARYMSNPGATAGILMTTEIDGSHKIILQHRSKNNYFYPDVPGASIAGYLDEYLATDQRGTIQPVDTNSIKENNLREMDEELGLPPEDISQVRITGIATDNIRYHTEFLLLGISKLTTKEVAAKVADAAKRNRPHDAFDFEGQFVALDATPEAIATLLTTVRCPLPPTHAAAFVAAGYSLMFERDGLVAANAWRDRMQNEVTENYRQINAMVVSYWAKHPEQAQKHPADKPPHNIFGYDPNYPPNGEDGQGLHSLEEELVRVGLMSKEESKKEQELLHPQKAYLFDVDGVLTNPEAKRVEQEAIFDELAKRLMRGEPVGLNTGRSLAFIDEQVLQPLEARLKGMHLLQNLFAIGEKGAAWITYDENDQRIVHVDNSVSVLQEVQDKVRKLIAQPPYNDIMFFDETKQTMVSVELLLGKTVAEFQEPQRQLNLALQALLIKYGLQDEFRVDPTRIATDIENKRVGKHLGARRFVELLRERGIEPQEYLGFGDSASDYGMYEELQRLGKRAHFVFVGGREHLAGKPEDGVIFTNESVDKGTLEYLQNEEDN